MKSKSIYLFLFLLLAASFSFAQNSDSTASKSQFKISINHNSGLNYFGRTDSLKSKGLFPLAELWFTPKFYVNAAPIFVYNKFQAPAYAGSVATIGYLNVSKKWISNLYLLKPFYTESSELVQSALKAQTGGSFTFLNKLLNISAGGDVKLSDKLDFGAMVGIDHIFRIENKNKSVLVFDPSLTFNAGTQNFSKTYSRKSGGILPREQKVTKDYQEFNLLSIEASLPIIYAKGRMQLIATPAYVVPKNLVNIQGRPDLSETGKNMFYTTLTVKYAF